ncbi:hypothetical protein Tco_0759403, partial [Tanacetum coccineum]
MSTPDYIYLIIVPSDSNAENAFSSINTPDYTPASPDYSPASSGNTSSNPSEDLSKDLLASLTISPFHDDPYMKVMQAYNANNNESPILPPQAPIAPPTVLPLSPVFEIGESSHKTRLERHKEQIETILNHLDELPLERIEHMEDKIEGLGNGRITMALLPPSFLEPLYPDMINDKDIEHMIPPTPPRDTKPPFGSPIPLSSSVGSSSPATIKKLVADSVVAALEAQAATMANADNTNRNTRQRETTVARKCRYKEFMSCQPFNFKEMQYASHRTLQCQVSDLQQGRSPDQELQKQGASQWKQPAANVSNLSCLWRERALQKLVPKGKQQCPWKSILAEGQERSPRLECSHGFDVIIGMDWLSKYHARIIYDEKVVHIPIDGETLIIQVMEKKSNEKRLEDIPVVREFLEVFPEDLPGLPPIRQVEYQIDLIPGAAPVARALYRLAP